MKNLPVRFALFAVIFASFSAGVFAQAESEPLYYIYHGQAKPLTLDSTQVAVRVANSPAVPRTSAALPASLVNQGLTEADIVSRPQPNWLIINAQRVASGPVASARSVSPANTSPSAVASVHDVMASLLNSGDPSIEFVSPVFRDNRGGPVIITPTVLIGFKPEIQGQQRNTVRISVPEGAQPQHVEFPQPNNERWQIQSKDGFAVLSRANQLAMTDGVSYAEPDMIITGYTDLVPTDPNFGDSWGSKNTGQSNGKVGFDMEATAAWDVTMGSPSVIVLIIDGGVQQDHPDINQVAGKDFTPDAGANPSAGPVGQYDNHATAVAGCVSARINNGLGSAGIAPNVRVAGARCSYHPQSNGSFSLQYSWVVDALNWGQSIGARVSSNSNTYGDSSSAIEDAYATTRTNGMVHFAAAGNDGANYISYPSSIPSVNAVGAAQRSGYRTSFSNYGDGIKYLAPGQQIFTTDRTGTFGYGSGDYVTVDGTSFASPYAAGVAALIISQDPTLTAADVETRMQNNCTDIGPAGYDLQNGYGMIDAYRSLARITSSLNPPSVQVGNPFSYQITANNNPTSFEATGLPSGLSLNATTGLISGTPTVAGTFPVNVIAHGPGISLTATVQIVITAPAITSALNPPSVHVGTSFSYQITASNSPTGFEATGLPAGLQLDTISGLVSGTPTEFGTFNVNVTAHGSVADATGTVHIIIIGPSITSWLFPSITNIGGQFNYYITAEDNPTGFEASGLPSGLQINTSTGLISGIPDTPGNYQITLIAHTQYGDATAILSLTVKPPTITSGPYPGVVSISGNYAYQITANVTPTSYDAVGLPDGLHLDPQTGQITGMPTLSGVYQITVIAHTVYGDAVYNLQLTVNALPTPDLPVTTFPIFARVLAADPIRPRIYMASDTDIKILDLASMSLQTVPMSSINDISVSADASKLWFTRAQQTTIGALDLQTLTFLPGVTTSVLGGQIREGLQGRLYIEGWDNSNNNFGLAIFQIDSATGTTQSHFTPLPAGYESFGNLIEISPDRTTLFAGTWGNNAFPFAQYDISSVTPTLAHTINGGGIQSVVVRRDGKAMCFDPYGNPSLTSVTPELSATDITKPIGSFGWSPPTGPLTFSTDGLHAFQVAGDYSGRVAVFDTQTFGLTQTIHLKNDDPHNGMSVLQMITDYTDTFLVVSAGGPQLQLYRLKPEPPLPRSLTNVSTRTFVQTGDNVEIGGFIIHGDQPKKVVLRAIGPTLGAYGLPAVTDPVLELHDSAGAVVATNDNWNAHRADVLSTGLAPPNEHEAVIVATLQPGSYTAILSGLNGATGTALFELYDVDPTNSKIYNISTRSNVGTGDNVMIGGFIIGGDQPTDIIVRAIGPTLTQYGVDGALQDPVLELHDGSGNLITQNDDWQSDQRQAIINAGFAPPDSRESAILATLSPGNYTAIVRGKNNTTGVALVEVYNLNSN